ncbi:MAG: chloride channel protein [Planctomycetes bacterium]|nr:chloride channel protein [Planctomycetota bacterium]
MAGLAIVVGVVAGIGGILFLYASDWVFHHMMAGLAGYAPSGPRGEKHLFANHDVGPVIAWAIVLIPGLGGLVSGFICNRFAPEAKGHGTDAAIDAYHRRGGLIRSRVPFIKGLATAITLGTGGSGGREGPIAQIGAGFGSFLATKLKLGQRQRRILLAAGMGAGVGAVFRAPLAGALFASEILYREAEFESEVLLPSFMSSAVAYCVLCGWFGEFGTLFLIEKAPVFDHLSELGVYTVMGLLLVPVIWFYIKTFYGLEHLFERLPWPKPLVAAFGGLLTGGTALAAWKLSGDPDSLSVLSAGYGVIQRGLDGIVNGWEGVRILLIVALLKIFTTSFTISSGGSGGVFGPSMVIGGGVGGAIGLAAKQLGYVSDPTSFIIVGMCGFFAGAARTPISTIIMVSEMTGSYKLLLPAMWVCTITFALASPWTLYRKQVLTRAHSPAHKGEFMVPLLQNMFVRDVLEDRNFPTVTIGTPLRDVLMLVASTHADYFPVLDDDGRLAGIFSAHDVRSFTYDDTLNELAVAADLMTTNIISVSPDDDLHVALQRFNLKNIDELPVVANDDKNKLVGMMRRRALSRAYHQRLQELREEAE